MTNSHLSKFNSVSLMFSKTGSRFLLSNSIKAIMIVLVLFVNSGFAFGSDIVPAKNAHKSAHTKCWACNGSGECSSCSGTGKKTCYNCGGNGTITDQYTGKSSTCRVCNGSGSLKCSSCNGSGTCSTCHGTGVLNK